MTTIELPIEESFLAELDRVALTNALSRTDFILRTLEAVLRRQQIRSLEQQDREGYERNPILPGEFDVWETEQVWEES